MAVETMTDRCVTTRRAWLAATAALADHTDDCLSCLVEWLPNCDESLTLGQAAADAFDRYGLEVLP